MGCICTQEEVKVQKAQQLSLHELYMPNKGRRKNQFEKENNLAYSTDFNSELGKTSNREILKSKNLNLPNNIIIEKENIGVKSIRSEIQSPNRNPVKAIKEIKINMKDFEENGLNGSKKNNNSMLDNIKEDVDDKAHTIDSIINNDITKTEITKTANNNQPDSIINKEYNNKNTENNINKKDIISENKECTSLKKNPTIFSKTSNKDVVSEGKISNDHFKFNIRKKLSNAKLSELSNSKIDFTYFNKETINQDLLQEINEARQHPERYYLKMNSLSQQILELSNEEKAKYKGEYKSINDLNSFFSDSWMKTAKYKIKFNDICNVVLKKGLAEFKSTLDMLKNFEGMQEMNLVDELCLEIPDDVSQWTKREHISSLLRKLEYTGKYGHIAFHYDIGVLNPTVAVVLQLVDDSPFRGNRRANILNSNYNYIGISTKIIGNLICSYYTFTSKANGKE